jgi:type II secretory pathway component PulF
LREDLGAAVMEVNEGRGLGASLESAGALPRVVTGMVSVGEETGHLEDTLQRISRSAFQQGERRMKTAVGLIEPALIIFLGLVVGFIVASIMLPIFQVDIGV